ncbi:hypothetical protein GCM10022628_07740 [Anoxybacillus suryakundensis]
MDQTAEEPTKEKTGSAEKVNQKDSYRFKRNIWQSKNHKNPSETRSRGISKNGRQNHERWEHSFKNKEKI